MVTAKDGIYCLHRLIRSMKVYVSLYFHLYLNARLRASALDISPSIVFTVCAESITKCSRVTYEHSCVCIQRSLSRGSIICPSRAAFSFSSCFCFMPPFANTTAGTVVLVLEFAHAALHRCTHVFLPELSRGLKPHRITSTWWLISRLHDLQRCSFRTPSRDKPTLLLLSACLTRRRRRENPTLGYLPVEVLRYIRSISADMVEHDHQKAQKASPDHHLHHELHPKRTHQQHQRHQHRERKRETNRETNSETKEHGEKGHNSQSKEVKTSEW